MTITQSSTRFVATVGGAVVALGLMFGAIAAPVHAAALTPSQVSAIVSLLQSFGADANTIANVQASLNGQATTGSTTTTTGSTSCTTTFTSNMTVGSTGSAVMALQKFLNMDAATMVASSGAGSPGMETSTFGPATKAAVMKFQTKYGISPVSGYVGPLSRAKLNSLCSTSSTTTTTTTTTTPGGNATVTAGAQPANGSAPLGAARIPFTNFTVTAGATPVTLSGVTVERDGVSADAAFAGVELINASTGVQLGISRVFNSNHQATIGSTVVIPAGTSMMFTVAANRNTTDGSALYNGQVASISVLSVNTDGTVQASYPIVGASNTVNANLVIGTATIQSSSFDPNNSSTQPVGTTAYRFSGIRINAGSTEDLTFKSITWYQAGSASGLSNIKTVVNGTSYPTTMDSSGRYYTTVFPTGIVIAKGNSVDAYVQADLGGNTTSGTTAEFDIYRNTDIYLIGNQYGFGISPTGTSFGAGVSGSVCTTAPAATCFLGVSTATPYFRGSGITVTGGTFSTIQNNSSVGSQNIAVNVNNQPLGGFQTNLTGEGVTAQTVKVHFTASSAIAPLLNVSLVMSGGSVVSGPFNATCDNAGTTCTAQTVTFSGSVNFPVGLQSYVIQGQVPSGTANGVTIQASTNPSSDWTSLTGNTTGNNVTIASGNFTMNTMTVQAASITVANSSSLPSQTIVAGGTNVALANIQLDASQSGEDVRINSLPVSFVLANFATTTDLSNCQIWNGTTALNTGSQVVNSANINGGVAQGGVGPTTNAATFSFTNSLTVPKGTIVNLTLSCSITSAAANGATYKVTVGTPTATGAVSGNTVTPTVNSSSAATMTVAAGATLAAATNSQAPAYSVAAGGTTGVTMNVITLRATNEAINLQKLALTLTSGNPADVSQVYIYAGNNVMTTSGAAVTAGTLVGTASFTGNATTSTSTLSTLVQVPNNGQDSTFVIKADLADIGTNQPGTEGDLVKVDYNSVRGTGVSSGRTVDGGALTGAGVQGVRVFNTFPTIALGSLSTAGVAGDGQLIRFAVTADSHGALGVDQFKFNIASSTGVALSNLALYAYTDSAYSQPANGTNGGVAVSGLVLTGTNSVTATLTTPIQVSAGTSIYFLLKGTVSYSGAASTYNVSTTLLGDSTGVGAINATTATTTYNFVWSPNATSTASITPGQPGVGDWTNGFGIIGLPSIGVTQSRSN